MSISKFIKFILVSIFSIVVFSCVKDTSDPQITGSFEVEFNKETLPIEVNIVSTIKNAKEYNWSFPGGTPSYSSLANPGTIIYTERGKYTITLKAENDDSAIETPYTFNLYEDIVVDFDYTQTINGTIASLDFKNNSVSATNFTWEFEQGIPFSSEEQEPHDIRYLKSGEFNVTLTASNEYESESITEKVKVNIPLIDIDFDFEVSGNEPPATVNIVSVNTCPLSYKWTFEGGSPTNSSETLPQNISYTTGGEYQIKLEASNYDSTVTIIKSFYLSNGQINTYSDITLGGTNLESTTGIAFSTKTGTRYFPTQYTNEIGNEIDIAFVGMDGLRFFASPDNVDNWGLTEIPNATNTDFINYMAGSSINFTVEMFDNMTDDTPLKNLEITDDGESFPASSEPFIVLFKNSQGKVGAIKVKTLQTGSNGFIEFDVKVQK